MRADVDLPWFYGTGSSTAAGDAGLRSSLGGQVARLAASQLSDAARAAARDYDGWQKRSGEGHGVDASQIEDDAIKRLGTGHHLAEVSARLAAVADEHRDALALHYGHRSLVFGVSAAALLTELGRRHGMALADVLRDAVKARKPAVLVELETETGKLVEAAKLAYENADVPKRRKVWASCGPGCGKSCKCQAIGELEARWPAKDGQGTTEERQRLEVP